MDLTKDEQAIIQALRKLQGRDPNLSKAERITLRRLRVLEYTYRDGLTTRTIAEMITESGDPVDHSTIVRDLQWWQRRKAKATAAPDELVADLEFRYETIYQRAMQEAVLVDGRSVSAHRDKARLWITALAAGTALERVRGGTGKIRRVERSAADDDEPRTSTAAEIRRITEEVRRLAGTGMIEDAHRIDLTAPGERDYLDAEVVHPSSSAAHEVSED